VRILHERSENKTKNTRSGTRCSGMSTASYIKNNIILYACRAYIDGFTKPSRQNVSIKSTVATRHHSIFKSNNFHATSFSGKSIFDVVRLKKKERKRTINFLDASIRKKNNKTRVKSPRSRTRYGADSYAILMKKL